jgi:hypothetical protein
LSWITNDVADAYNPAWAPGGTQIAVDASRTDEKPIDAQRAGFQRGRPATVACESRVAPQLSGANRASRLWDRCARRFLSPERAKSTGGKANPKVDSDLLVKKLS